MAQIPDDPFERLGIQLLTQLGGQFNAPTPPPPIADMPNADPMTGPKMAPMGPAVAPQQQPAQAPNFGRTFGNKMYDFGRALQGADVGHANQIEAAKNKTFEFLVSKGLDPQAAETAVRNPAIMQQLLASVFAPKTQKLAQGEILVGSQGGQPIASNVPRDITVPAGGTLVRDGKAILTTQKDLSTDDKKAIREAEDENKNLAGTIDALKRAATLNKDAFTGVTAGARGWLGTSNIPGANQVIDRGGAMATRELDQLLGLESVKQMSSILKGATTDRELFEFQRLLSDPSTPPEIREKTINRMLQVAESKKVLNASRAQDIRGRTYYQPGGAGTKDIEPSAAIAEAKKAIAAGKDPAAVRARLQELGISTEGL